MKVLEFRLIFHWILFLGVQLTISQRWFRWWLGADDGIVFWCIYASLGLKELTVNKLFLDAVKTKQIKQHLNAWLSQLLKSNSKWKYSRPKINDKKDRTSLMNRSSYSGNIANKIYHTFYIMNRLKRCLPFSAMKLMYDSLILSPLQFGITCWGFEWNRICKRQKQDLRMMTNSNDNAHTEPLFKELEMLNVSDIFDVQSMNFQPELSGLVMFWHDDVIKWKHFPRYCPFGHRWIPRTKASDMELWCFLWSAPEWTIEQTVVRLVIWDAIVPIMTSQ